MKTKTISLVDLLDSRDDNTALQDLTISELVEFAGIEITTWTGFAIEISRDQEKMTIAYG